MSTYPTDVLGKLTLVTRMYTERDELIVAARREGYTWRQIAEAAGLTELATRQAATRGNEGTLPKPKAQTH